MLIAQIHIHVAEAARLAERHRDSIIEFTDAIQSVTPVTEMVPPSTATTRSAIC
jgi:hypothetical protein